MLKICVFHNKFYIKRNGKKEDMSLCGKYYFKSLQTKIDYLTKLGHLVNLENKIRTNSKEKKGNEMK